MGFSNYEPHLNERVEAFPVVIDPDGDSASLTYEWLLNGAPIEGKDRPTIKLSSLGDLAADDTLQVKVTAADLELEVVYTSSAITLQRKSQHKRVY